MGVLKEVMMTALIGLSPILIALIIGAICWAARHFGDPTKRNETRRNAQCRMSRNETRRNGQSRFVRYETRRNRPVRVNGGVRHG